jgi:hypothetical protein
MYDIEDEKFNSWKKEKVPLLFEMLDKDIGRDSIGVFMTNLLECAYMDGYNFHKAEIEKMLLERLKKAEKELAESKKEEQKLVALHEDLTKRVNDIKTPQRQ